MNKIVLRDICAETTLKEWWNTVYPLLPEDNRDASTWLGEYVKQINLINDIDEEECVGFLSYSKHTDGYLLSTLFIKKWHRKKGYGKKALEELTKLISNEMCDTDIIFGWVRLDNKSAINFYKSIGCTFLDFDNEFTIENPNTTTAMIDANGFYCFKLV